MLRCRRRFAPTCLAKSEIPLRRGGSREKAAGPLLSRAPCSPFHSLCGYIPVSLQLKGEASGESWPAALAEWVRQKREQLRRLAAPDVRNLVPTVQDFALAVSTQRRELSVVAEIARATPEEGGLRQSLDVVQLSGQLEPAGAAALAVATDEVACAAEPSDLPLAARASSCPVVARDLILAPEQLYRLRLMGADAVLLAAG